MSELKAFGVGLGQYTEDGSPCVVAFDADQNPRLLNERVYLKSEADKVIAEKDEKIDELEERIDELQKATDSAWRNVNAMYDELRHHKYKRCLAMAGKCECGKLIYQYKQRCGDADTETGLDYLMKRAGWYRKWQLRWLEIAEQLKEAK